MKTYTAHIGYNSRSYMDVTVEAGSHEDALDAAVKWVEENTSDADGFTIIDTADEDGDRADWEYDIPDPWVSMSYITKADARVICLALALLRGEDDLSENTLERATAIHRSLQEQIKRVHGGWRHENLLGRP